MTIEVWGTFSVADHTAPGAFRSEVMLFDRLVVPVPPENDPAEYQRWKANGWDPERQARLLAPLGDRVVKVPWDENRRERWRLRFAANKEVEDAFTATRGALLESIPDDVTAVQALAALGDYQNAAVEVNLQRVDATAVSGWGRLVCILGREFLVPNDPHHDEIELLKDAIELSSDRAFRRTRASLWRWTREFLASHQGIVNTFTLRAAVEEMRDLLEDEQEHARKSKIHTGVQFAFVAASVTVGLLSAPLAPLAIGGAFLSIGQFFSDKLLAPPDGTQPSPAALFRDATKHFGWR